MKINHKILFFLSSLILVFSFVGPALAADDCFCATKISAVSALDLAKNPDKVWQAICRTSPAKQCYTSDAEDKQYLAADCGRSATAQDCSDLVKQWQTDYAAKVQSAHYTGGSAAGSVSTANSKLSQLIIDCGQPGRLDKWTNGQCKDITVFVLLLLQLVDYLFSIIGAISLGVFVYGGFVLILSQGNPEKVQAGTGAMTNAVIGLFVSLTAYVLVSFLGQALGLSKAFTLL